MSYYILGQTLPLKYFHLIIVLEGTKQSLYYYFFLIVWVGGILELL